MVKGEVVIGVRHENVCHHQSFEFLKGSIMCRGPSPLAFAGESSQRGENMHVARPHVAVRVDCADESTELFNLGRFLHGKDSFNLLVPRLQASRHEPEPSQSVSFTAHSHLRGLT